MMAGYEVLVTGLSFPEAPRWRADKLWFSDFYMHRVQTVDLSGQVETVAVVPKQPSGLGFTPAGELLVVSMLDRCLLAVRSGTIRLVADLSTIATGPCNDMVVDAKGRAYVGNFGYDRHGGEPHRDARLARVDPDGSVTIVATDLNFPNGMVILPDGNTLVVCESYASRLSAFDIDPDGGLHKRRLFAKIHDFVPDGMCSDADGAVWVADPRGKRVIRLFDGGQIVQSLSTGDRGAYACMLGGPDGRTLFICTNTAAGPPAAQKRDGQIVITRVNVPGDGLP